MKLFKRVTLVGVLISSFTLAACEETIFEEEVEETEVVEEVVKNEKTPPQSELSKEYEDYLYDFIDKAYDLRGRQMSFIKEYSYSKGDVNNTFRERFDKLREDIYEHHGTFQQVSPVTEHDKSIQILLDDFNSNTRSDINTVSLMFYGTLSANEVSRELQFTDSRMKILINAIAE